MQYPIAHIEIPAADAQTASSFYRDVFGWKIETNTEHNYTIFESEASFRGGFLNTSEQMYKPDRLLVYLGTDDIDATLATVEANGGKTIVPKTEIPHVGWWAIFADPNGNHVGLYHRLSDQ